MALELRVGVVCFERSLEFVLIVCSSLFEVEKLYGMLDNDRPKVVV